MNTNTTNTNARLCKKIRFGLHERPTILLGILLSEDSDFIIFRTANKKYHIARKEILSIEDTSVVFRENGGNSDGY